ncbi:methyl-accepting chemotaxis protein [Rhizobium rhizosphaerae]|uniref:Methyl-accepting chemotaxis protein n=2 Tax=Xaviernesmea rhizosphaerae TaxID=1672749 RepID=A0ABX3PAP4_9HYPH|nr:methyl-accepting chemotaxis protein [Xaviernesmea rhizosphaerae]
MSILANMRIQTKILAITILFFAGGCIGASLISYRFYKADEAYSDFISQDATVTMMMARAGQRIFATAYSTYEIMVYDGASAEAAAAQKAYLDHKEALGKLLRRIPELLPQEAGTFSAFEKEANTILALTDKAVTAGLRNDNDEAKALLKEADPLISQLTTQMRKWNDDHIAMVQKDSDAMSDQTVFTITTTLAGLFTIFSLGLVAAILVSRRGITQPVHALRARMAALAAGDADSTVPGLERKDELGEMAAAVAIFRDAAVTQKRMEQEATDTRQQSDSDREQRDVLRQREAAQIRFAIDNIASGLTALSDGDLDYRLDTAFAEDLDQLRQDFNRAMNTLRQTVQGVSESARGIDAGAREIRTAANDLAKRTEQQAASVEETAAALEQITTTVRDATARAEEAGALVARARAGAERSGEVMSQAVSAMVEIEKSSAEISNIIGVIDEIAFQTNLLALNAGVEAARAGEAGKGFAVVAQEVRELAQRSAQAAKEIKALISTSGNQVQNGVDLVGRTGQSLRQIVTDVEQIDRNVRAIVESAREQSTGLQEINTAVNTIDQNTQQNAAMVEESTAASHNLSQEIDTLTGLLAHFRMQGGGGQTGGRREPGLAAPARGETAPHAYQQKLRAAFSR